MIIIVAILAAVAIPIYTNSIEEKRGKACQNNIRMIIAAWRLYNLERRDNEDFESPKGMPGTAMTVPQINQRFGISIDEKYFNAKNAGSPGYNFMFDEANTSMIIRGYRGGSGRGSIQCNYNYATGAYQWIPNGLSYPLDL